jgi:hypothetical protein
MVRGLVWEQEKTMWKLNHGGNNSISIDDISFHGIYSSHEFFKGLG